MFRGVEIYLSAGSPIYLSRKSGMSRVLKAMASVPGPLSGKDTAGSLTLYRSELKPWPTGLRDGIQCLELTEAFRCKSAAENKQQRGSACLKSTNRGQPRAPAEDQLRSSL